MTYFYLAEKVAIVTGAASGIGYCTAKELVKNGIKGITLVDINEKAGKDVLESFSEFGSRILFVQADVSNKAQFEEAFKRTLEVFGHIDLLINNASVLNDMEWEREIDINIKGTVNGVLLAMDHYITNHKSGHEGLILNIASICVFDIEGSVPMYTATKFGILGLTLSFADSTHYNLTNVKLATICPGGTITPLQTNVSERVYSKQYLQKTNKVRNPPQSAEHVGKSIVEIIKRCNNGSIWIVENYESPYEVAIPSKEQLRNSV